MKLASTLEISFMKYLFIFPFLLLSLSSGAQLLPKIELAPPQSAKILIETDNHYFGDIKEGVVAEHVFKIKNTGEVPLIISHIGNSCDCTSASFTNSPIAPGEIGEIAVKFDTKLRPGPFNKTFTVVYNSDQSPALISIEGNVVMK